MRKTMAKMSCLALFMLLVLPQISTAMIEWSHSTLYFSVYRACTAYTTIADCESNSCYWWDGACHSWPIISTDDCYIIDEEITLCITNAGTRYLIVDVGVYGKVIDIE